MKKKILLFSSLSLVTLCGVAALSFGGKSIGKTLGGSGEIWNHYEAVAATCSTKGIKEYWVGCSSHSHQFTAPTEYAEIVEKGAPTQSFIDSLEATDDRLVVQRHDYSVSSPVCSHCRSVMLNYTPNLRDATAMSENTTLDVPAGYKYLFTYNAECGGGAANKIWVNTVNSLVGVLSFKFSILSARSDYFRIQTPGDSSKTYRIPYQSDGHPADWVEITYTRSSITSTSWNVTSTQPEGTSAGAALNFTVTTAASAKDCLDYICRLIDQNPGGGWTPMTFTEMVLTDAGHKHNIVDNVCTICGNKVITPDNANLLWQPSNAAANGMPTPAGFEATYLYTGKTGGGAENCFIKHVSNNSYTKVSFAILVPKENSLKLYVPCVEKGDKNPGQMYLPVKDGVATWVTLTAEKIESTWYITNDIGNFKGYGNSVDAKTITSNTDYPGYLYNLLQILSDETSFCFTEFVAK